MESHHEGKGRIDEADTFVECAGVRKDEVGSGGETFAEQRYNRGVLCTGEFRGTCWKGFLRGLSS